MASKLIVALVFAAISAVPAGAQVWSENFDSYTSGSNIHGQGGWEGWENNSSAGALVWSVLSSSPSNSVAVTGDSDPVHPFSGIDSGRWLMSVRQYIPSASVGESYVILLNQYGSVENWSIQTCFNIGTGSISCVDPANGTVYPPTPTIVYDTWVNIQYDINLNANTVSEYYNGSLLTTHVWQDGGINELQAIDLYANGANPVYYDDISLTQIPEPSSHALFAGLLGLGVVVYLRRGRA